MTRFTFPTKVDLVPGNLYVLELVQQLPSFGDGTGNFAWTAGAAGGTYAGGRSIRQGNVVSDRDFLFATGANVPEPGTIGLVGTLVLGNLLTLRRRQGLTSE